MVFHEILSYLAQSVPSGGSAPDLPACALEIIPGLSPVARVVRGVRGLLLAVSRAPFRRVYAHGLSSGVACEPYNYSIAHCLTNCNLFLTNLEKYPQAVRSQPSIRPLALGSQTRPTLQRKATQVPRSDLLLYL